MIETDLRALLIDHLRNDAALAARFQAFHEELPRAATPPDLVMGPSTSSEWRAGGMNGREVRLLLNIRAAGDGPAAAGALSAMVEARMAEMPADWPDPQLHLASVLLIRTRVERLGNRLWSAQLDYRIRAHRPLDPLSSFTGG